jgi:hypothetical protein
VKSSTLTNTVLVLGMAVITGLLDPGLIPGIAPQAIAEIVIAVIIIPAGGNGGPEKNFRRIGGADTTILNRPLGVWVP